MSRILSLSILLELPSSMTRLLGLDYGRARIGIAITDKGRRIASPLKTLENRKGFFEQLKKEIKNYLPIDGIVLGLPLYLSGKDSDMTKEVREFSQKLEETLSTPVILWDERLTSLQIERELRDAGVNRKKRAEVSDALAATLILQSYLDRV